MLREINGPNLLVSNLYFLDRKILDLFLTYFGAGDFGFIVPITDDDGDYEHGDDGEEVDLVESLWECGDCDPPFGRRRYA